MNIAIIGTGNVGSVLGRRWSEIGHDVSFGSRRPEDEDGQALAAAAGATLTTQSEAAAGAEVVLLAVPGTAVENVVRSLGDLSGKIVVDCTNRHQLDPERDREISSLAELVAEIATGAHVVKAFNVTGSKNMDNPVYPDGPLSMPYCGDDADSKSAVRELITELGFVAVDNGPLSQARALEGMAIVWIAQAYQQGWGPDFGFAFLRR